MAPCLDMHDDWHVQPRHQGAGHIKVGKLVQAITQAVRQCRAFIVEIGSQPRRRTTRLIGPFEFEF